MASGCVPDIPGHFTDSEKAGINTFMTAKISWNQYNRMPHDTFKWKGIDGSEVLTHFITTPEPWNEPGSWFYTYNGKLIPKLSKEPGMHTVKSR